MHKILEAHYRGEDRPELDLELEDLALLEWMSDGYFQLYENDPRWQIEDVEFEAREWLPNRAGRRSKIELKGKIDLLIKDNSAGGGLWIVDHKTCRELPKDKDLEFDDQFGLYVWMLRKKGLPVKGVIHNAIRTYKLKSKPMLLSDRFRRTYTVRTDVELASIARECYEWFAGVKPLKPGALPRRATDPDRCGWRCGFTEPCLMSRKGGDVRELLQDLGCVQDFTRH